MATNLVTSDLDMQVHGRLGVITLGRTKALNALNLTMVQKLEAILASWADDAAIEGVAIRSASERAFCAGGDVRAIGILPEPEERAALGRAFFRAEYLANYRIATFPKPFIALMAGITMGGGLGLSVLGSRRIVGETLRMAMPETILGLFPDVGASWFLNRCPGMVGRYLALTGATLNAADALDAGLATHHVPVACFENLLDALARLGSLDEVAVDRVIADHAQPLEPGPLATRMGKIDDLFAGPDLDAVLERVAAARAHATWISEADETLRRASPSSLRATWRRILDGANQSLEQVLVEDFRMAVRMVALPDFAEGVRAILVDKDQTPRWTPPSVADVSPQSVRDMLLPVAIGRDPDGREIGDLALPVRS